MIFICVNSRFLFYNGIKNYTVEYLYSLYTWYVFDEENETDSLFHKKIEPKKYKSPNRDSAEQILYEYLNSITP